MRYWMLSNWNYENPIGELMSMWPPVLLVSAYITCVWEILFAALVWNPRTRLAVLGIGATFHLMTWLTLGLYIFPAICLAGYLCFVTPQDVIRVRRWLGNRSFASRWSWPTLTAIPRWVPAGVAWGVCGCLFTVMAVEAEVRNDLYGLNSPEGRYTLTEIDPETAMHRIRSEQPLREKDKIFSFHLGSTVVGGQLASRRTNFEFGEVVLAECNLNPPHEDMWIECNLNDDDDRTIESYGQFVTREMMRTHFSYHLGNRLVPGAERNDSPSNIRKLRQTVARIKTIQRERVLAGQVSGE